jgi:hypothetical protein
MTRDGNGVYLTGEGRSRFLREYERMMNAEFSVKAAAKRTSLRRALLEQALSMQKAVVENLSYQPFRGWR